MSRERNRITIYEIDKLCAYAERSEYETCGGNEFLPNFKKTNNGKNSQSVADYVLTVQSGLQLSSTGNSRITC